MRQRTLHGCAVTKSCIYNILQTNAGLSRSHWGPYLAGTMTPLLLIPRGAIPVHCGPTVPGILPAAARQYMDCTQPGFHSVECGCLGTSPSGPPGQCSCTPHYRWSPPRFPNWLQPSRPPQVGSTRYATWNTQMLSIHIWRESAQGAACWARSTRGASRHSRSSRSIGLA